MLGKRLRAYRLVFNSQSGDFVRGVPPLTLTSRLQIGGVRHSVGLGQHEPTEKAGGGKSGVGKHVYRDARAFGQCDEMFELMTSHSLASNRTIQDSLIQNSPKHRGVRAGKDGLPLHSRRQTLLHLLLCRARLTGENRTSVVGGL